MRRCTVSVDPCFCMILSLLVLVCLMAGCGPGGESGSLSPQPPRNAQLDQQAVENLLDLYQTALRQEDIDRLQDLLQPESAQAQAGARHQQSTQLQAAGTWQDATAFREGMSAAFRSRNLTGLQLLEQSTQVSGAPPRASFLEVESSVGRHPILEQQTSAVRTTLGLARTEAGGITTFRIVEVAQDGPRFQVTTPGQILAERPTRILATETTGAFPLAAVEVEVPETGDVQSLTAAEGFFYGLFTPPAQPNPQPLRVRFRGHGGEEVLLQHRYGLRIVGEGVVQPMMEAGSGRFSSVALAPDGTVWFGGSATSTGAVGTLVRVAADGTLLASLEPVVSPVLPEGTSRIEDVAIDRLGRVHAVFLTSVEAGVVGNGDIVFDPAHSEVFCQTTNAFDPAQAYPFRVDTDLDPRTAPVASPSARVLPAGGGNVWLYGSDGGIGQVTDTFREGQCPPGGVAVRYDPVFRRENSELLSNSVTALAVGADGALWFGTALGLTRLQNGQFTPVPFDAGVSLQGNPETLEAFFQAVAEAIFAARPLTTVALGGVSFVDEFGSPLVKADLIFSAVEDRQGRLWVGTLGGGIRRVEGSGGVPRDTRHLTRQDGLISNIVFALAAGPDSSIWAATDEGVSRIQEVDGQVSVANFSSLDGLALPVRDLAVDGAGTVWLATDGGLFRIVPQGGLVRGMVRDTAGRPVAGADVHIVDTPFQAVTDVEGRFTLANQPSGSRFLRFDASLAAGGPFTTAFRVVDINAGEQTLPTAVTLVPQDPAVAVDPVQGGQVTFARAPGARLDIPAGAAQFPPGESPAIALTPLPLDNLPLPLPAGFTIAAAADLQPAGTTFTAPVRLALPNTGGLPAGRLLFLLRLDEETLTYEEIGRGRVSNDGTVVTTISGGLTRFSTVVFASTPVTEGVQLVALQGTGQTGTVGQPLAAPLVVSVRDGAGVGVPGVPIAATVREGNGTLSVTTGTTDAAGQFATVLTLGTTAGLNRVEVSTLGLTQVVFTATGVGDRNTARLREVSGNNQTGLPGEPLPEPLVVRLEDQFGNPLAGETVTAALTRGQVTLTFPEIVTDAQGQAAFDVHIENNEAEGAIVEMTALQATPVQFRIIVNIITFASGSDVVVEANGSLIVLDVFLQGLVRVDPRIGVPILVSSEARGSGPPFNDPRGITIDGDGSILVANAFTSEVLRVDPQSGVRTVVSSADRGSGPPLAGPRDVAVNGGSIFVVDPVLPGVLEVNALTGDRRVLSSDTVGTGPPFGFASLAPQAIAFDASNGGSLVVVTFSAVVRVALGSGNRTILSGCTDDMSCVPVVGRTIGIDPPPPLPLGEGRGVAVRGNTVFVTDGNVGAVIRIDLPSGDRTVISGATDSLICTLSDPVLRPDLQAVIVGSGPCLDRPEGITFLNDTTLAVADSWLFNGTVVEVNLETGARFIHSFLREGS